MSAGERPFRCRLCGRAFTTKGNLKTHIAVHLSLAGRPLPSQTQATGQYAAANGAANGAANALASFANAREHEPEQKVRRLSAASSSSAALNLTTGARRRTTATATATTTTSAMANANAGTASAIPDTALAAGSGGGGYHSDAASFTLPLPLSCAAMAAGDGSVAASASPLQALLLAIAQQLAIAQGAACSQAPVALAPANNGAAGGDWPAVQLPTPSLNPLNLLYTVLAMQAMQQQQSASLSSYSSSPNASSASASASANGLVGAAHEMDVQPNANPTSQFTFEAPQAGAGVDALNLTHPQLPTSSVVRPACGPYALLSPSALSCPNVNPFSAAAASSCSPSAATNPYAASANLLAASCALSNACGIATSACSPLARAQLSGGGSSTCASVSPLHLVGAATERLDSLLHQQQHSLRQRLSNAMCGVCDKRFACRSALEIHMRSHTGTPPHMYCKVLMYCRIEKQSFSAASGARRSPENPFNARSAAQWITTHQ